MNRKEYFTTIADIVPGDELRYIQNAYHLAKDAHRKQSRRLTGERYFEHIRRVSFDVATRFHYTSAHYISLALLHDVIEDTYTPPSFIVSLFGRQMYDDILFLSKEVPSFNFVTGEVIGKFKLPDHEYYETLSNATKAARVIKGCDRIDNLADLVSWEPSRRERYVTETRGRIIPIVRSVDLRIANTIEERLTAAETKDPAPKEQFKR